MVDFLEPTARTIIAVGGTSAEARYSANLGELYRS
jgi:hypothetical protein